MSGFADLILWVPGLLLALSFHEFSHGYVAYRLGDPTPARAGRLTLNPLAHLDPIGTMMLFLFHFGWAKPVPVNPYYFRNPRRDMVLVAAAGPVANLILAVLAGLLAKLLVILGTSSRVLFYMVVYTMDINVILMMFNLIPIPPLDGSKVLFGLAKVDPQTEAFLERNGPMMLLVLILLGGLTNINIFSVWIMPFVRIFNGLFLS